LNKYVNLQIVQLFKYNYVNEQIKGHQTPPHSKSLATPLVKLASILSASEHL